MLAAGVNGKVVEELRETIKSYDSDIKRAVAKKENIRPAKIAILYYDKGKSLIKLAELVSWDKVKYHLEALDCLNKAVNLDSGNSLYLADRSKLYVALGNNDLAVKDVESIIMLPKSNDVVGMYVGNTIRDITALKAIQETVNQLSEKGVIVPELATALNEHARVTAGLVVQVGAHGEKLDKQEAKVAGHDNEIAELKLLVQELAEARKISDARNEELIGKFRQETAILKARVDANTEEIAGINERLSVLEDKLSPVKLEQLERVIERSELEEAGQRELEIIEQDACRLAFYHSVRWQMNSLYVASAAIATGMLENQKTGTVGKVGKVLDSVSGHIPFIGIGVQLIGEILQEVDKIEEGKKIEKYVELAVDNADMAKLAEHVARKLALKVGKSNIGNDVKQKFMLRLEETSENMHKVYDMAEWAAGVNSGSSATGSIAKATAHIYDKIKTKLSQSKGKGISKYSRLEHQESEPETQKGGILAKIVVKELTKSIYAGKIAPEGRPEEKAGELTKYITEYYEGKGINPYPEAADLKTYFLTEIIHDKPEVIKELYQSSEFDSKTINDLLGLLSVMQELDGNMGY